jgi:hypothetical protein
VCTRRDRSKIVCLGFLLLTAAAFHTVHANDSPLHVRAFTTPIANPFEARVGSMYQTNVDELRLDIGASIDLHRWGKGATGSRDSTTDDPWYSVGADFMTWTRLRAESNFKFPVETIDYWFGVNAQVGWGLWGARLRLAHISSHVVDGIVNDPVWTTGTPFIYSREFAEILVGRTIGYVRPYAGLTAVWTKQPADVDPIIPQAGADVRFPLTDMLWLMGGVDLRMISINGVYASARAAQIGVFTDVGSGACILLSLYGYNGRSMHGMFYDSFDRYLAIGMQILW